MDDQVSRSSKCLLDTPTTDWREGGREGGSSTVPSPDQVRPGHLLTSHSLLTESKSSVFILSAAPGPF